MGRKLDVPALWSEQMGAAVAKQRELAADAYSTDQSFAQMREAYNRERAFWNEGGPAPASTRNGTLPTRHGRVPVRMHRPSDAPRLPVIVYIHGGGYIATASLGQALLVDNLARTTGAELVVPLYPLAPHHTWEKAHRLVLDLYLRTVAENPGRRIVLMGDSAGGGLALVIALSLAERGANQPDELVLLSPWVDVTHVNPDIADYVDVDPLMAPEPLTIMGKTWAGDTPTTDWHLSPINGNLSALHRVTTFVGSRELFLPDNALLHDRLVKAGVTSTLHVGENLNHVYPMFPSPEGRRARREIARIVSGRASA